MRTIYVDSEMHCHVEDIGHCTAVKTSFFDDKCDTFVEGYCYDDRNGVAIYPWRPYAELEAAQVKYEQEQRIKTLEAQNAMLTECLLEISEIIYS